MTDDVKVDPVSFVSVHDVSMVGDELLQQVLLDQTKHSWVNGEGYKSRKTMKKVTNQEKIFVEVEPAKVTL